MTSPITRQRDIESLKVAGWPGADQATLVVLAARLAAADADADRYRFFQQQADAQPGQALPLAFAGYFQARLGTDSGPALAKLDQAAKAGLGLPQYLRGLALAGLAPDRQRARQAVTDLEFVLAVRDQFPLGMIRAAYCGLAAAYTALGKDEQAAEAATRSGLGSLPWHSRLLVSSWWMTGDDGFRFTTPKIFSPEANVHVAQGYDFADFSLRVPVMLFMRGRGAAGGPGTEPRRRPSLNGFTATQHISPNHVIEFDASDPGRAICHSCM
jgi:hypothetical protein